MWSATPSRGVVAMPRPQDRHDEQLLANVRPAGWRNPVPAERYHLVVVGGGTAGVLAATLAAERGVRVALVERRLLGGSRLHGGCVPSMAWVAAARAWHAAGAVHRRFGGPAVHGGTGDFGAVAQRMRHLRAAVSSLDAAEHLAELGIDVFFGAGRFVAGDAVEVDGRRLRFRRALIATGASPLVPQVPGLEEAEYLLHEDLFSLTEAPSRLIVVGAGASGCEMAQAAARFGIEVAVVEAAPRILPRLEADAAAVVQRAMARDGVRFLLGAEVVEARREEGACRLVVERPEAGREVLTADQLLIAAGRAAAVEDLGLEAAAVQYDHSGVDVDARLRTTNPRIYAAGDVASPVRSSAVAASQARVVVANALAFGRRRFDARLVPRVVHTSPEIACVGVAAGGRSETLRVPLAAVDGARLEGEDDGFLELHLRRGSDRIAGATLVAERAGELIAPLCLAMTHRLGLRKLARTLVPYPTQTQVYRQAADLWRARQPPPRPWRWLAAWLRALG